MKPRNALLALALIFTASAASAAELWFHLDVTDARRPDRRVRVQLPFTLVTRALPLIPNARDCDLVLNDERVEVNEFRRVLALARNAPENVWVDVTSALRASTDGARRQLHANRKGEWLFLHVRNEFEEPATIRLPMEIADALAANGTRHENFAEAAKRLSSRGAGELLLVQRDGTNVRMWVDAAMMR